MKDYERHKQGKIGKTALLSRFQKKGYFLIDACDYPIDRYKNRIRDEHVRKNFLRLLTELNSAITDKARTKIILVKKNVYQILDEKLRAEGFNGVNPEFLDFHGSGRQKIFRKS
ncbi:MAG: hypothetical protein JRJ03_14430 [Deltaproteobacteria bacterium]|nr:hypothetical protein [Deltaproteobacteria bacterium]